MLSIESLQDQRAYFESGATRDFNSRKQHLLAFKKAVLKNEKEIAEALAADLKKTPEECWVTETGLLIQEINYILGHLSQWMRPEKVETNLLNLPSGSYLYPAPKGVVLIIGPWNFPLQLLLIPVAGAIAAGNCVVVKPSEFAPATAAIAEKLIKESLPQTLAQVVQGDGAEVVPAMMNQFRFDHVFYTGSIPVGKSIYQLAAKDLVPVTLELGGKDPCIVESDANISVAARRIAVGKFTNAGQMCVCPDYLLVHEKVKDKLLKKIKEAIDQFYTEDPASAYGYGKIINEKRFDKLVSFLSQGHLVHGGKHDRSKLYIEPTIMDEVSLDSPLMTEEIFGPILPVFTFSTKEEVLKIIARNPNPLSFYVFTSNRSKEEDWLQSVQFGTGCVNNTAWQFSNHHLPFGGVGQSGLGAYHGKHSFDVFTHKKAVMKTPTWFDPAIKYPPLKGKMSILKLFIR